MNKQFRTEEERKVTLSRIEKDKILDIEPKGKTISKSVYFDNYNLPCPILIEVNLEDGFSKKVVLRKTRRGDVKKETQIIKELEKFGLPVPKVLVEPFQNEKDEWCAVYSLLPGENLQKLSIRSEEDLNLAKKLLIEGVKRLADASGFIAESKNVDLPSITLSDELEEIKKSKSSWLGNEIFKNAVEIVGAQLDNIKTPLILSNGDYQPGNFLAENKKLTGFIDFESSSFQDPIMGFVKYPIYDLKPLSGTDLIDKFLETMHFSKKDFSIRLVLGCLKILIKEIEVSEGDSEMKDYRERTLAILEDGLEIIKS